MRIQNVQVITHLAEVDDMAYNGYLVKVLSPNTNVVSDFVFPMNYILEKTYTMTYSVLDYNSTRNADGQLIRNVLDHKVAHCSFDVKKMTNDKLGELFRNLRARFTTSQLNSSKEKQVRLSVYIPETDEYITDYFYIPDIELSINHIFDNVVQYNSFKMEFIGY